MPEMVHIFSELNKSKMEQLIIAEIIKIRENRKRPCAETIWSQLSKNGHQYEFSNVAETISMMEHSGLIANRPHKGEDSFFVTSKKPSPDLTAESHPHNDAIESDTSIVTKASVNSKEEYTPYIEFEALQHTVFEIQRAMQTFNGNLAISKDKEIEKLKKENEFLRNELCRKNLIIESLQSIPISNQILESREGFQYPRSKHTIKHHASLPIQRSPLKTDMNRFAPLDNSNSRERDSYMRDEVENNANSKTRHLDITKPRQRTSNIHNRKAGHKNTKTTSSDRLSNSNGKGMKETSGEVVQNRRVYIIGDSMIKGIKHWKMQSKDTKVVVRSFAGAKTRQMKHYAKPAEEDNPSLYILHVGINDLKENKSAVEIADEITSLARSLKKDNNEVKVSGICPRGDNLNDKASGVNKILEQRCKHYQLGFINHKQMDAKYHTNGSNLHLNRAGDSILAKSFLCEIRM